VKLIKDFAQNKLGSSWSFDGTYLNVLSDSKFMWFDELERGVFNHHTWKNMNSDVAKL